MSDNRRAFVKKAAGAAAGLAGAEALLGSSGSAASLAPEGAAIIKPSYSTARFALDIEGEMAGLLRSLEGGEAEAQVVETVKDCLVVKSVGGGDRPAIRFNPIVMSFSTNMAQSFYDWIALGLTCDGAGSENSRSGAIITADANNNEVGHLNFKQALLTAFTLPAADASSKDAGTMTLQINPRDASRQKPSGKMSSPCLTKNQKGFQASNFRLSIDGLDCSKVTKIESMTILWEGDWESTRLLRFPNLVVSMPEGFSQSFFDWHEDFVMSEKHNEKSGRLEFLSPNLQEVLMTVNFKGLGIFKVGPDKMTVGNEGIKKVTAEMYCNGISIEAGKNVGC